MTVALAPRLVTAATMILSPSVRVDDGSAATSASGSVGAALSGGHGAGSRPKATAAIARAASWACRKSVMSRSSHRQ